jgi:hypothetical protein
MLPRVEGGGMLPRVEGGGMLPRVEGGGTLGLTEGGGTLGRRSAPTEGGGGWLRVDGTDPPLPLPLIEGGGPAGGGIVGRKARRAMWGSYASRPRSTRSPAHS